MRKKEKKELKNRFRVFFLCSESYGAENFPELNRLGITNIKIKEKRKQINFIVTLTNPGLLIGRKGRIIKKTESVLSDTKPVKIVIKQSKLWK